MLGSVEYSLKFFTLSFTFTLRPIIKKFLFFIPLVSP